MVPDGIWFQEFGCWWAGPREGYWDVQKTPWTYRGYPRTYRMLPGRLMATLAEEDRPTLWLDRPLLKRLTLCIYWVQKARIKYPTLQMVRKCR